MGSGRFVLAACVAVASAAWSASSLRAAPPAANAAPYRAMLDQYCVTCHNQRLKTAGLMLDTISLESVPRDAETWEKVVKKLRARAMPPQGARKPDEATYHR